MFLIATTCITNKQLKHNKAINLDGIIYCSDRKIGPVFFFLTTSTAISQLSISSVGYMSGCFVELNVSSSTASRESQFLRSRQ